MRPWVGVSCVILLGSLWVVRGCEGPLQSILTSKPAAGLFAGLDESGLNCFNFQTLTIACKKPAPVTQWLQSTTQTPDQEFSGTAEPQWHNPTLCPLTLNYHITLVSDTSLHTLSAVSFQPTEEKQPSFSWLSQNGS